MTKPKERLQPTSADTKNPHTKRWEQDQDAGSRLWDTITAEIGAKTVLQCPDCAAQPTSLIDLEKHTKAVHGAESVRTTDQDTGLGYEAERDEKISKAQNPA